MTVARRQRSFLSCILLLLCTACTLRAQSTPHARNVILVMTDGLRWQELFRGADETLLTRDRFYAGRDVTELKQQFLAPTADERRAKLMPFFWSFFPAQGTVFGDGDQGSVASVTNGFNFSYPGYSETLTGHPDPRIHSNDNIPNPNTTVFEFLNHQPGFSGQVAAFGAWDVFAGIFNAQRCGFPVNAGYAPLMAAHSPRIDLLNAMKLDAPRNWPDEPYDSPVFETALEYIRIQHPRVLFLSLGETDEWAHAGNYGEYLLAAHRADSYLQRLWTALQSHAGVPRQHRHHLCQRPRPRQRPRHLERPRRKDPGIQKHLYRACRPRRPQQGCTQQRTRRHSKPGRGHPCTARRRKLESSGTRRRHASPTAAVTGRTALAARRDEVRQR